MKMVAEYLERAHQFERMAEHETDPKLKADFERQASAYYKLAEKRAVDMGFSPPQAGKNSN